MLWTIVGVLLIVILLPLSVQSIPALWTLVRRAVGSLAGILIAFVALVAVLASAVWLMRIVTSGIARLFNADTGFAVVLFGGACAALYAAHRYMGRAGERGPRPSGGWGSSRS